MIRKTVTRGFMAVTAVAMALAFLAPSQSFVEADPICVGAKVTGVWNQQVGPYCGQFNRGTNCQMFDAGVSPTLDVTVDECVPRP